MEITACPVCGTSVFRNNDKALARHRAEQAVITAAKALNDLYALSRPITMPERIAVSRALMDALAALAQLEATDATA